MEDEDIIIPDTLFGELLYIYYIGGEILTKKEKWFELKRQIIFFFRCHYNFMI